MPRFRSGVRASCPARVSGLAVMAALLLTPGLRAQGVAPRNVAASLERVFGHGARAETLLVAGDTVLRVTLGDSLLGFARVRDVRGKEQPITLLVAVDSGLRLRDIDILAYREAYGGEVAYDSWRKQFRGRGADDGFEVGRGIRGISGATISVNAVTLGVRETMAAFARWRVEGRL